MNTNKFGQNVSSASKKSVRLLKEKFLFISEFNSSCDVIEHTSQKRENNNNKKILFNKKKLCVEITKHIVNITKRGNR